MIILDKKRPEVPPLWRQGKFLNSTTLMYIKKKKKKKKHANALQLGT